jgi:hypothetical protein
VCCQIFHGPEVGLDHAALPSMLAFSISKGGERSAAKQRPRKRDPASGEPVVVPQQPHEIAQLDKWMGEHDDE